MKPIGDLMKKLLIGVLFAFFLLCFPSEKANSVVSITSPDGFAIACNAAYIRVVPHHCLYSSFTGGNLTSDGVCRSLAATVVAIPSQARAIDYSLKLSYQSANAVANRTITTSFYLDSGCTTLIADGSKNHTMREWVALAAQVFSAEQYYSIGNVTQGLGDLWYTSTLTACVGCVVGFNLIGYYD